MLGLRSRKQSDDIQSLADVPVGVTVTLGASHVDERLCRRLSQLGLRSVSYTHLTLPTKA